MRLPAVLFGWVLVNAGLLVAAVWYGADAGPQLAPHATLPSMLVGGDGASRLAPVWPGRGTVLGFATWLVFLSIPSRTAGFFHTIECLLALAILAVVPLGSELLSGGETSAARRCLRTSWSKARASPRLTLSTRIPSVSPISIKARSCG